ncbi:uL30 family ribosomal protein [Candidatus Woesearchaeota archaeon]|nr:uL30 family ribosomal protein [Candidatus Woesearchaeota archaeon]
MENRKFAVILVRGEAKVPQQIKDTLALLTLHRKNHCVIVNDTPALRGMIAKVKDFVTWGEITAEVFKELLEKRGLPYGGRLQDRTKLYSYPYLTYGKKHFKSYFRLNPPRKGFGRKGIKIAFAAGGALGYRGEKINDLLLRMI